MSQFPTGELHGSAPGCPVCGGPCTEPFAAPVPFDVKMEQEKATRDRPQRMWTVREDVLSEDGSLQHNAGKLIPLDEAVAMNLPGAVEVSLGGRKPTHAVHDRARHPEGDRAR